MAYLLPIRVQNDEITDAGNPVALAYPGHNLEMVHIAKHRTAMVSVDNTQPVHRGIRVAQHSIDCRNSLSLRHVVNIDLLKSAE